MRAATALASNRSHAGNHGKAWISGKNSALNETVRSLPVAATGHYIAV
jgi:hypothetical protein